jgi:hypothetical protein
MELGCRRRHGGIPQVRLGTTCDMRCWRVGFEGMVSYIRYLPLVARYDERCGPDALG